MFVCQGVVSGGVSLWEVVFMMKWRVVLATMVMVKVSVHPAGLGPRESAKAWYSGYCITGLYF